MGFMPPQPRLTLATRRVLATMLDQPGETYAYDLARETDLPSGTVVQILARLERAGIVTSRAEDIDPRTARRPARKYYRLTPVGRTYVEGIL